MRSTMRHPRHRCVAAAALVAGLTLAACGSSDESADTGRDLVVDIEAIDFAFLADEAITIAAGDTVEFRVRNNGDVEHELEVLTAENRTLGRTERIPPGATRSVTVTFDSPGVHQVVCDIDDHRRLGQNAQFDVTG